MNLDSLLSLSDNQEKTSAKFTFPFKASKMAATVGVVNLWRSLSSSFFKLNYLKKSIPKYTGKICNQHVVLDKHCHNSILKMQILSGSGKCIFLEKSYSAKRDVMK